MVIGEDSSERLDVIPAQFRVLVTRRPKLACRACAGVVVQRPAPPRLIEGGIPTEATVAHVLVSPLRRPPSALSPGADLARQGVELDRSTLASWVGTAAAEIAPVVARLKEIVLASARLFADETVVPVLDPGRGRTKQGYFWAIARDDRPWGGHDPPAVVYTYAPGRGHAHGRALLGGYRGILQCDGYAAYKKLADPTTTGGNPACSPSAGPMCAAASMTSPRAATRRSRPRRWSASPRSIGSRPTSAAAALPSGRWHAMPTADRYFRICARGSRRRPRSCSREARPPRRSAYALNHWDGLIRFLDDGRIEIDSNTVERSMRPVALSRKNALFAGSDEGGRNWACGRLADRDLQAQRRRSAALPCRSPAPPRQRLAPGSYRRAHALVLERRAPQLTPKPLPKGPGTSLTHLRGIIVIDCDRRRALNTLLAVEDVEPRVSAFVDPKALHLDVPTAPHLTH